MKKAAREAYFKVIASDHTNLIVFERGLVIHQNYTHLGASSDAYVSYSCCGPGVIEVLMATSVTVAVDLV